MGFLADHAPAFGRRARSLGHHPDSSSDGLPGSECRFGRHERQRDRLRALPLLHAVAMVDVVHGRNRPVEEASPAGPWRHRQPRSSAFRGSQSDERPCPLRAAPSANHLGLRLPNLRVWTEAGDQLPRVHSDQAPAVAALDHEPALLHDGPQGPVAHVPLVPANHCHCDGSVSVPGLFRNRTQCARGTGRYARSAKSGCLLPFINSFAALQSGRTRDPGVWRARLSAFGAAYVRSVRRGPI